MKYHEWITEEGLLTVEGWAREGLVDSQIAQNIGISKDTLIEWKKRFPEFSEALKRGKAPVDYEVENALLKRALGYTVAETKTVKEKTENGERRIQKITTERYIPPNVTAIIFWLKNRKPDIWGDRSIVTLQAGEDDPLTASLRETAELLMKQRSKNESQ